MSVRPVVGILVAGMLLGVATHVAAQVLASSRQPYAFNGAVMDTKQSGNVLYVGGGFTTASPAGNSASGFVELTATGSSRRSFPRFPGLSNISAIVDDGGGGWYVGGFFTAVEAIAQAYLVHFRADGTIDPTFTPVLNSPVRALARGGSVLYAGGQITGVNGVPRGGAAAFNIVTGALLPWNPSVTGSPATPGLVNSIAVAGSRVFLGGLFTAAGGQPRSNLVAVNAVTGALDAFIGNANNFVLVVHVTGTTLYAGGHFTTLGGVPRQRLGAVNVNTSAVLPFVAATDAEVVSLGSNATHLFVAGAFTQVGGQPRNKLASVDLLTGSISAWDPGLETNAFVSSLVVQSGGSEVSLGGYFSRVGGVRRASLATVPATGTGRPATAWNPGVDNTVFALAAAPGGGVAAGGFFTRYGARVREGLAAIDVVTGELLPLSIGLDDGGTGPYIEALEVAGNTLYLGGAFSSINNAPRSNAGAIDARTGAVLSWNPGAMGGPVSALIAQAANVYVGGHFTAIGGLARPYLAGIDAQTGLVTAWNSNVAGGAVLDLKVAGPTLYVAGRFTQLAGQPRNRLGAVDLASQLATTFNPNVTGDRVSSVFVSGNQLYIGGQFSAVAGQPRLNVAAVDRTAATPTAFAPALTGPLEEIAVSGGVAYMGGTFSSVNGAARRHLAAVDAATGAATLPLDLALPANGSVQDVTLLSGALVAGGTSSSAGSLTAREGLYVLPDAAMTGVPGPPSPPRPMVLGSSLSMTWTPSPLGGVPSDFLIEAATAPGASAVAVLSNATPASTFSFAGAPPGLYYVRLRARNAFGVSLPSPEVGVVFGDPLCTTPPQPPDVTASVSGANVALAWTHAVGLATGYTLRVGSVPGAFNLGTFSLGGGTSFSATAGPGTYFVRLIASGPCGVSAPSAETLISIGGVAPPPAPFAASQVSGSTVTISWAAVPDAIRYQLTAGSGPLLSNVTVVNTSNTALTAGGVPAGTYYVRVSAIDTTGLASTSRELVVIVP